MLCINMYWYVLIRINIPNNIYYIYIYYFQTLPLLTIPVAGVAPMASRLTQSTPFARHASATAFQDGSTSRDVAHSTTESRDVEFIGCTLSLSFPLSFSIWHTYIYTHTHTHYIYIYCTYIHIHNIYTHTHTILYNIYTVYIHIHTHTIYIHIHTQYYIVYTLYTYTYTHTLYIYICMHTLYIFYTICIYIY